MARMQRGAVGDDRWNALWGRGGRGMLAAALAIVALALPVGAYANDGDGKGTADGTYVNADVVTQAEASPNEPVRVIVQSRQDADEARDAVEAAIDEAADEASEGADAAASELGEVTRELELVDAVAAELTAAAIEELAERPGLVVVPDAPVRASGLGNTQQWPHATGNSRLWLNDEATYSAAMPTIAIVDSGIEAGRADFAGRVVADVKLGLGEGDEGDSRGHGTFVAGIAAGAAEGYAGAAPMAKIFSIDVMDANGMAFVSDVIAACEVILANKNSHNIRVANFSLHSAWPASVRWDPLAHAVEKLWFGGIVVVAAAGNYGNADGPSGVGFAPGSDPFVITVGAGDLTGGAPGTRPRVNSPAPWSAWGYTHDGFAKPELVAPGRYMVAAVPESSTLVAERPGSVVAPGYMQLSGTSFAAPVVSGTVAQMLARNPNLTPDQVKGALMLTARPVEGALQGAAGVGQITASRAIAVSSPPNPNAGLNQFLVYGGGELPIFDAEAWGEAVQSDAAWNGAAWSDAAWSSAAWSSAAWSSAAWSSGSFEAAAWSDAAWSSAAWSDAAWSDGAGYDGTADTQISSEQLAQLDCDPELSSPEDGGGADCGGESAGGESGGSESGGESGGEQPTEESSSEQSTEESGGEQAEEGTGEGSTEELGEQPAEEYSGE